MKTILTYIILFLLSIILQTTVMPLFAIKGIYPDAVVLVVVLLSINHGRMAGIWGGFFVGLLLDVYSPSHLGLQSLAKTITGTFVGYFGHDSIDMGPVGHLIILIIAVVLHDIIIYVPTVLENNINFGNIFGFIIKEALPRALYTALLSSIILFTRQYFTPTRRR